MGGKLVIAGGNLEYCDKIIHKLLIEYAGGTEAKLVIVPTASGEDPISTMKYVEDLWIELGIKPDNIIKLPIYGEEGKGWRQPALGDDDEILKMLDGATGFWFTGGDQYYTHKAFIRKDGTDTKILKEIREIYINGGVIGGTSAGAAIMSEVMIASGNNMTALNLPTLYGYEDYDDESRVEDLRIVKGLGFFTEGIIDQHFDKRPRILRLIKAVTDPNNNLYMGYGVSEDTAMIYDRDSKNITVVGSGAVYIVDCSKIEKTKSTDSCTFKDAILNVIKEGDLYNQSENNIVFMD